MTSFSFSNALLAYQVCGKFLFSENVTKLFHFYHQWFHLCTQERIELCMMFLEKLGLQFWETILKWTYGVLCLTVWTENDKFLYSVFGIELPFLWKHIRPDYEVIWLDTIYLKHLKEINYSFRYKNEYHMKHLVICFMERHNILWYVSGTKWHPSLVCPYIMLCWILRVSANKVLI